MASRSPDKKRVTSRPLSPINKRRKSVASSDHESTKNLQDSIKSDRRSRSPTSHRSPFPAGSALEHRPYLHRQLLDRLTPIGDLARKCYDHQNPVVRQTDSLHPSSLPLGKLPSSRDTSRSNSFCESFSGLPDLVPSSVSPSTRSTSSDRHEDPRESGGGLSDFSMLTQGLAVRSRPLPESSKHAKAQAKEEEPAQSRTELSTNDSQIDVLATKMKKATEERHEEAAGSDRAATIAKREELSPDGKHKDLLQLRFCISTTPLEQLNLLEQGYRDALANGSSKPMKLSPVGASCIYSEKPKSMSEEAYDYWKGKPDATNHQLDEIRLAPVDRSGGAPEVIDRTHPFEKGDEETPDRSYPFHRSNCPSPSLSQFPTKEFPGDSDPDNSDDFKIRGRALQTHHGRKAFTLSETTLDLESHEKRLFETEPTTDSGTRRESKRDERKHQKGGRLDQGLNESGHSNALKGNEVVTEPAEEPRETLRQARTRTESQGQLEPFPEFSREELAMGGEPAPTRRQRKKQSRRPWRGWRWQAKLSAAPITNSNQDHRVQKQKACKCHKGRRRDRPSRVSQGRGAHHASNGASVTLPTPQPAPPARSTPIATSVPSNLEEQDGEENVRREKNVKVEAWTNSIGGVTAGRNSPPKSDTPVSIPREQRDRFSSSTDDGNCCLCSCFGHARWLWGHSKKSSAERPVQLRERLGDIRPLPSGRTLTESHLDEHAQQTDDPGHWNRGSTEDAYDISSNQAERVSQPDQGTITQHGTSSQPMRSDEVATSSLPQVEYITDDIQPTAADLKHRRLPPGSSQSEGDKEKLFSDDPRPRPFIRGRLHTA
ncbi:MAG: hypothetical protein Q9222_003819 [Ikaeria aurantiellina]